MTDSVIETALYNAFLTLNEVSGQSWIMYNAQGKPTNVARPNINFSPPAGRRFFVLSYLPAEPDQFELGRDGYNRYTGIYQCDICLPPNIGKAEAEEKFAWIKRIFYRGARIGDYIRIDKCYRATEEAEGDYYRLVVRVEWTADLPEFDE